MARPVFVFLVIASLQAIPNSGNLLAARAEPTPHAWEQEAGNASSTPQSATSETNSSVSPASSVPGMRGIEGDPLESNPSNKIDSAVENEKPSSTLKRNNASSKSFFEDFFSNPLNFALLLVVFVYIALMFMGPRNLRKEQREHAERLKNLKKNDRVVTSAGIHGVVANINTEANTISLRVDENTNTKITIDKASIRSIVSQS